MKDKFNFEDLKVYQEALIFVELVYFLTKSWPNEEVYGLTNQLRRASVSFCLNLAEGSSRTKRDSRHFIDLSKGSCYECFSILLIARRLGYIKESEHSSSASSLYKIAKMLSGLKRSIL